MSQDAESPDGPEATAHHGRSPEETPTIITAPPTHPSQLTPGTLVANRYRIVAILGRGGMGAVYRADDRVLGQQVALKFISGHASPRAIERLTDEVRVGRRITHPNVCRLHDIGDAGGRRFLVMEYVDGEDLASLLARTGTLPYETTLGIAHDLAAGLAAAHAEGIVHRDLKPGNVMIDGRGRARITDLGLAIAASGSDRAGEIAGTPAYMAPEQFTGEPVDARADIYALGLILVELFTGRRLNEGRQTLEIASAPPEAPASLTPWVPQIDPEVERFVLRALEPDPSERPGSARELLRLLPEGDPLQAAFAAGETPTPEMVVASFKSGTLRVREAAPIVLAIIIILVAVAAVARRATLYPLSNVDPATLQSLAKAVVKEIAPDLEASSTAWWFEVDREMIRSDAYQATKSQAEVAALEPKLIRFVWRQSNRPLAARGASSSVSSLYILESGKVTRDDPPPGPGMATVALDRNGGLIRAEAIGEGGETRSSPLGRASIEPPPPRSDVARLTDLAQVTMMIGSFVVAIVLAIRNRRTGRADVRGASRLAVYVFSSLMLAWLFLANHVPDASSEARLFSVAFGSATTAGVILWFFYVALEPFVRRHLPETLVSWSRLVNGRLRDSLVARDLLIGITGGCVGRLLIDVLQGAPALWGGHPRMSLTMEPIGPLRRLLGNALLLQVDSIEIGIGMLFFLVVFQRVLKRTSFAVVAVLVLFIGGSLSAPTLVPYLALLILLLVRFGLLTAVTTNLVTGILLHASLTLDPGAWFFGRSMAVLSVIAATAIMLAYLVTRPVDEVRSTKRTFSTGDSNAPTARIV